ncbi:MULTISPECIES: GNAT family N-acetyltransferase [Roseomonadaceae]|uniref:GNAT family N-acetyltransferase n=1 Tax=Falsiroseomonas oleicola TaxID=2801474 RepID=A0ABS6H634_9PROT|nr:GNAT family N-acetyltransferase [Roseomonas oleicola]MBU8544134.1 GNAT family N-acetyltransferase [Roseomonas oleicola]
MTALSPASALAGRAAFRILDPAAPVSELTSLLHRAYAPLAAMGPRYMATHQSDAVTRERAASGECWVARADGGIVGTILFKPADRTAGSPWLDRPEVASLGQFAVAPEWQGTGLGARLLDLAERRAAETGAKEIALDTAEPAEHLVALYRRRGYRFIEHTQWSHTNYRSVIMSKPVRSGRAAA